MRTQVLDRVRRALLAVRGLHGMLTRLHHFDLHLRKPFDNLEDVESVVAQAIALHDART